VVFPTHVEKIYDRQNGWVKIFTITFRGENMKGSKIHHLGVSENGGFSPQIIHFNRDFHYKSSILGENPYLLVQHPPGCIYQPIYGISASRASRIDGFDGMECFVGPPFNNDPWKYGEKMQRQKKEDGRCFGLGTN